MSDHGRKATPALRAESGEANGVRKRDREEPRKAGRGRPRARRNSSDNTVTPRHSVDVGGGGDSASASGRRRHHHRHHRHHSRDGSNQDSRHHHRHHRHHSRDGSNQDSRHGPSGGATPTARLRGELTAVSITASALDSPHAVGVAGVSVLDPPRNTHRQHNTAHGTPRSARHANWKPRGPTTNAAFNSSGTSSSSSRSRSSSTGSTSSSSRSSRSSRSSSPTSSSSSSASSSSSRDQRMHYPQLRAGQHLGAGRYEVDRVLGKGVFSRVVAAWDNGDGVGAVRDGHPRRHDGVHQTLQVVPAIRRLVAVKVFRGLRRYQEAAEDEQAILARLAAADGDGDYGYLPLLGCCFQEPPHYGLVFPLCGPSLYSVMCDNDGSGFSLHAVRSIAFQLLKCLAFVHACGVVHTDIKPENILFRSRDFLRHGGFQDPVHTQIALCDFGNAEVEAACAAKRGPGSGARIIQTRHYRAPEVILQAGWSYPADVWSIGCLLPELLSGDMLFATHDDEEHMALMQRVLGSCSQRTLSTCFALGSRYRKFFGPTRDAPSSAFTTAAVAVTPTRFSDPAGDPQSTSVLSPPPTTGRPGGFLAAARETLFQRQRQPQPQQQQQRPAGPLAQTTPASAEHVLRWPTDRVSRQSYEFVVGAPTLASACRAERHPAFYDLVSRLLAYDPAKRLQAREALHHPFFFEPR